MSTSILAHESRDKIRDTVSSILGSAVRYQLLVRNSIEGVQLPPNRKGERVTKPNITSEQFDQILAEIPEPYATMVYVAVYSGLRVSELIGLRWNDVGEDCLMVDERSCRGDWSAPKSEASNAAVAVQRHVIERGLVILCWSNEFPRPNPVGYGFIQLVFEESLGLLGV